MAAQDARRGRTGRRDQAIAIYRDCTRALADVPTHPAESTRRLLEQLRF
jgi:hypothetical protein